jgi:multicomponent Na+:H+ antiporter subunit D
MTAEGPVWLAWLMVLPVVLPLTAGLAAVVLGRHAHRLALPTGVASLCAALGVVALVYRDGVLTLSVGAWAPPLGILLRIDGLSAAFLLTSALVSTAAMLNARVDFGAAQARETRAAYSFWPLGFLVVAGVNAVLLSNDLFNLYVALELLTLTAVGLVALDGKPAALSAAFRYLLFALLGSLAYLLGAALLYAAYGTLDLTLLAARLRRDDVSLLAGGLMTAGLMAKMAIFPLHGWLAPAHASAPAAGSALLSALVVKAPFVILLRLWFTVLPTVATSATATMLGVLGAGGVLLGSVLALSQARLKRLIAYSTVAQLGYLFLVFPLAGGADDVQPWSAGAYTGVILHGLAHALAKAAMFLAAGVFVAVRGSDVLDELSGVSREAPVAVFAFGLAAVSLMGLPLSGGFTAKYLLLTSAVAGGQWWWALLLIAGGLLAAQYLFGALTRFLEGQAPANDGVEVGSDFVPDAPANRALAPRAPRMPQVLAFGLAVSAIALGLFSATPYRLLQIGQPFAAEEGIK